MSASEIIVSCAIVHWLRQALNERNENETHTKYALNAFKALTFSSYLKFGNWSFSPLFLTRKKIVDEYHIISNDVNGCETATDNLCQFQ